MRAYVDSGVLVRIYVPEEGTEKAIREVRRLEQVPLIPLHELEIRNALRVQAGRGLIRSEELSRGYATAILCRSLDIMHVAAAMILGCRSFLTGDKRQADLASAVGLKSTTLVAGGT